jgi:alpha-L-fucosidase
MKRWRKYPIRPAVVAGCLVILVALATAQDTRNPSNERYLNWTKDYIELEPDADYHNATPAALEAFRDMKYGVRIHWGIYSDAGFNDASWPFLKLPFAERQKYQELYKTWNPTGFHAEEWMQLFSRNGVKVLAFTSKHHEGFSMFDTKTRVKRRVNWIAPGGPKIEECDLAYSIMETPFKRDVVKEISDAAHRYGIKLDLYFSNPDWYDADFRPYGWHPLWTPGLTDNKAEFSITGDLAKRNPAGMMMPVPVVTVPDPSPEEQARMMARYRQQLVELASNYGKVDMMCLDNWFGKRTWPETKQAIKDIRKIQPAVMLRSRGIGNYGDYYTPEGFVPGSKSNTDMPWMVIYALGPTWVYEPNPEKYKDVSWIVKNLVDIVAKGGNFMVGIGPDSTGRFHPKVVSALQEAGEWLRVNGEAIYATRPREGELWKEGDSIRFTRSKDRRFVYAISLGWPGKSITLKSVQAKPGSSIVMLGVKEPLHWRKDENGGLVIDISAALQDEANRPCKLAYAVKIEM